MKSESVSFIDDLVGEAEEKEQKLNREMADLMLLEIRNLQEEIEKTFEQAERERADAAAPLDVDDGHRDERGHRFFDAPSVFPEPPDAGSHFFEM